MTIKQCLSERLNSKSDYIGLVLALRSGGFAHIFPDAREADYEGFTEIEDITHGSHLEELFLVQVYGGIAYAAPISFGEPVQVFDDEQEP